MNLEIGVTADTLSADKIWKKNKRPQRASLLNQLIQKKINRNSREFKPTQSVFSFWRITQRSFQSAVEFFSDLVDGTTSFELMRT